MFIGFRNIRVYTAYVDNDAEDIKTDARHDVAYIGYNPGSYSLL